MLKTQDVVPQWLEAQRGKVGRFSSWVQLYSKVSSLKVPRLGISPSATSFLIEEAILILIQLNEIIPLRTLHHNLIELGHFFAATAIQLLSYFAEYPVL